MIKKLPSLLLVVAIGVLLQACGGLSADDAYEYQKWKLAAEKYEKEFKGLKVSKKSPEEEKDEKQELAAKIAQCYSKMNDYKKAERWYENAIDNRYVDVGPDDEKPLYRTPDPTYLYEYALTLKKLGEYEKAIKVLEYYQEQVPNDTRAEKQIAICEEAKRFYDEGLETQYQVKREASLSSTSSDYSPIITEDGLVFTSTREGDDEEGVATKQEHEWDGQLKPDLFIAKKQRGRNAKGLEKPVLLESDGIINTEESEGSATFGDKMRVMYFTSCNRVKEVNDEKQRDSNCVIMTSQRRGRNWTEPQRLDFCTDSSKNIHYGQPALSADGNKLYFSSNMPGGEGGHDIWVCTWVKKTKSWSAPINLGPSINTEKDEMFPSPHGEEELYFSSNGHLGYGGLDMFVTTGRGQEWSVPRNLLSPMNSMGDDFGITFETDRKKIRAIGEHGYFSSNRDSRRGYDDIFSFVKVPLEHTVSGHVINRKTGEFIANAKVTLYNNTDTTQVYTTTDDNGYYFMQLNEELDYSLDAYKKNFNYNDPAATVSTKGLRVSTDFERDLYLEPMPVSFELDILYELDSHRITPQAAAKLDSFSENWLKVHYYTVMELSSHTDCRGSDDYNRELAQRRADAAVNYLVSTGIDRERFVPKGYGEDKPKCDTLSGEYASYGYKCLTCDFITQFESSDSAKFTDFHQMNRRTEIRILRKDYVPEGGVKEEGQSYEEQQKEQERLRKQMLEEMEGGGDGN